MSTTTTGPDTTAAGSPGGSTSTVTAPREPGDHDRFAHYALKRKIARSMVEGTPVVALCGKVWVPSRDPRLFPLCPACKEVHASLTGGS